MRYAIYNIRLLNFLHDKPSAGKLSKFYLSLTQNKLRTLTEHQYEPELNFPYSSQCKLPMPHLFEICEVVSKTYQAVRPQDLHFTLT